MITKKDLWGGVSEESEWDGWGCKGKMQSHLQK